MTTLGLFVKYPRPGRVKSRLAKSLGAEQSCELYAAFVHDLVERFRRVADRRVLCFTPAADDSRRFISQLGGDDYELWPQPESGLGERMAAFVRDRLRQPDDRVVIIGSDSPTLPREHVTAAFEHLGRSDVVLGPATDGGFYLAGMRGRCWPIFDGIEWSTPTVLADTIARVRQAGAALALLPPWYDVDTEADFHLLRGHIAGLIHAGAADELRATLRVLALDRETGSNGYNPHS